MTRLRSCLGLLLLGITMLIPHDARAAAGVALRWANCYSDAGIANKTFACNSNVGAEVLVATFQIANSASPVFGYQTHLAVATAGSVLPAWWGFMNVGSCRQGSLAMNTIQPFTSTVCQDAWAGQAASGVGVYTVGALGPASARIAGVGALPGSSPASLTAGVEYYGYSLTINHQKTVGTNACAGCSTPACIMIEDIQLFGAANALVASLTTPSNGADSHFVTWQGGAGVPTMPNGGCSGAVPVRNRSWTSIKTLYR